MTENEAREFLGRFSLDRIGYASGKEVDTERFNYFTEVLMTAMQALTEIQQYRAIGTVEYFKECADILNKTATDELAKIIDEWILYHKIGTVEECREAMERQRGKKPNITTGKTEEDKLACCPICEGNLDWTYNGFWRKGNPKYCSNCGQSIDWSDAP